MIENFLRPPRGAAEICADAVRIAGLLSVIAAAVWFSPTDAGVLAFALPALLAPRFVGVRAWFDIAFGITILVAAWSNVVDLYTRVDGWDIVVHVVCTGVIAALLYEALADAGIVERPGVRGVRVAPALVITPALALAVSALWEMVEWAGYVFVTDEIFVSYQDTIGDMAAGGVGGLAAGVLLASVPLKRPQPITSPSTPARL